MNDDYIDVSEMMKLCGIVRRKTMHDSYIAPALADGSIERKYPEQPNHPKQMYRLTEKAKNWKKLDVFWLWLHQIYFLTMKGDAQPLIKFFDGSDKRFIILLYQRNYDWKEENGEQLFQDLMKLHNSDCRSHFFGSIVSSIQSGTDDRFIIYCNKFIYGQS